MENLTYRTPIQSSLLLDDSDSNRVSEVSLSYSKHTSMPKSITKFLTEIEVTNLDSEQSAAVYELARNLALHDISKRVNCITNADDLFEYLQSTLMGLDYEVFGLIFLDAQGFVIEHHEMFRGSISSAPVYCREIVKAALKASAESALIFHNHPSSDLEPSQADKAITTRIEQALLTVDIKLKDHIIVSKAGFSSFTREGLL